MKKLVMAVLLGGAVYGGQCEMGIDYLKEVLSTKEHVTGITYRQGREASTIKLRKFGDVLYVSRYDYDIKTWKQIYKDATKKDTVLIGKLKHQLAELMDIEKVTEKLKVVCNGLKISTGNSNYGFKQSYYTKLEFSPSEVKMVTEILKEYIVYLENQDISYRDMLRNREIAKDIQDKKDLELFKKGL